MSFASYSETFRVPFGDTDAAGVVFYPNYYRWFDRMTHELFRHIGMPLHQFLQSEEGPVLVDTGCTFFHPLRYDDEVVLKAEIAAVGNRSFRIAHTVTRGGIATAKGFEVRAWVRMEQGRVTAVEVPAELRGRMTEGA